MKHLFFTLAALLVISTVSAQRRQLRQFTNDFAEIGQTHRVGLSFLPLRVVSWFIPRRAWDGEAVHLKWALKKVKSLKLYTVQLPEGQPIPRESIALLKTNLRSESNFETLMEVRRKKSNIYLLSDSPGHEKLNNLVVLVQDGEEMVMAHLRTRLTMKDVSRIVNTLQRLENTEVKSTASGSGTVAQQN